MDKTALLQALFNCVWKSDLAGAGQVLREGAEVNGSCPAKSYKYLHALHIAASRGDAPMVELLLDLGADIDIRMDNNEMFTPLMCATDYGKPESMKALIGRGAKVDLLTGDGNSISMLAAGTQNNAHEVWDVLLDPDTGLKDDIHPRNKEYTRDLMEAAFKASIDEAVPCAPEALAAVMRRTAYVDRIQNGTDDLLHRLLIHHAIFGDAREGKAAYTDRIARIISHVLDEGLSPYVLNEYGSTAYTAATTCGPELSKVFQDARVKLLPTLHHFNPQTDRLLDDEGKGTWLLFNYCGARLLGDVLSTRHWSNPRELRELKEAVSRALPEHYRDIFAAVLDTSADWRAEVKKDNPLRRRLFKDGRG